MAKRSNLAQLASESADQRTAKQSPARHAGVKKAPKRDVQVVGYSLYPTEVAWVEQTASSLKKGLPLASRSFIVRQAILHLQQELDGKSAKEVRRFFLEKLADADEE